MNFCIYMITVQLKNFYHIIFFTFMYSIDIFLDYFIFITIYIIIL